MSRGYSSFLRRMTNALSMNPCCTNPGWSGVVSGDAPSAWHTAATLHPVARAVYPGTTQRGGSARTAKTWVLRVLHL